MSLEAGKRLALVLGVLLAGTALLFGPGLWGWRRSACSGLAIAALICAAASGAISAIQWIEA